jgi:hypothetical protein
VGRRLDDIGAYWIVFHGSRFYPSRKPETAISGMVTAQNIRSPGPAQFSSFTFASFTIF